MKYILSIFLSLGLVIPVFTQVGCSSGQLAESNSAEAAFKAAEEYEKDERYEEALTKYSEVKNKHPYSRYAVEAELKIADVQFKKESFLEAQTAYQLFKDFHPKHPKSDYVTYQLALSYFNQLPSTIDRDISIANKAIQYFDEVVNLYSSSGYVNDSKEKRNVCYKQLAEKEMYIGEFYFIRDMYDSALKRFEGLLKTYPDRGFDEEALYKAGVSAFESGNKELGKKYLDQLISRFPQGEYTPKGKGALAKYGGR